MTRDSGVQEAKAEYWLSQAQESTYRARILLKKHEQGRVPTEELVEAVKQADDDVSTLTEALSELTESQIAELAKELS